MNTRNDHLGIGFYREAEAFGKRLAPKTARLAIVLAGIVLACASMGRSAESFRDDELLRLVPADSAVTISIENLREQLPKVLRSSLVAGLFKLPVVHDWWEQTGQARIEEAKKHVEAETQLPWATVRDEILGDAVVLALDPNQNAGPAHARGLLLVRARDRAALQKMLDATGEMRKKEGLLVSQSRHEHMGTSYTTREFKEGTRPNDHFVLLANGVLGWSNSEHWIKRVIELASRPAQDGLGSKAAVREIHRRLPSNPLISVYIDLRLCAPLLLGPGQGDGEERRRPVKFIERLFSQISYLGAALEVRDGILLHICESFDSKDVKSSAAEAAVVDKELLGLLRRVPGTALMAMGGRIDLVGLVDAVSELEWIPAENQRSLELFQATLDGLLMGRDLKKEILPNVGPLALAVVETEESSRAAKPQRAEADQTKAVHAGKAEKSSVPFHAIGLLSVGGDPGPDGPAAAIENASRTLIALLGLSSEAGGESPKIQTQTSHGSQITTLVAADGKTWPAFARQGGLLFFGSSASIVAAALARQPDAPAAANLRFDLYQAGNLKEGVRDFVYLDLVAIRRLIQRNRKEVSEWLEDAASEQDLDQLLALFSLLETATIEHSTSPDGKTALQTLSLKTSSDEPVKKNP